MGDAWNQARSLSTQGTIGQADNPITAKKQAKNSSALLDTDEAEKQQAEN
jgi:hypothetical protein